MGQLLALTGLAAGSTQWIPLLTAHCSCIVQESF
jgi:hypothetical protein